MANCCEFLLKAKGFKSIEDTDAFIEVFENNFDSTLDGCDVSKPYMAIYGDTNTSVIDGIVVVDGLCKWSIQTSMLKTSGLGYANSSDSENYTCLEELSEKYGITIEVYSRERGMGY